MHGVKLPPALLADLYGDMLVIVEDGQRNTGNTVPQVLAKINLPQVDENPSSETETPPKKIVVEIPATQEHTEPDLLGRYGKKILVLVNEQQYKHCSENDLQFLQKILQALKLSMDDIGILNLANQPMNYSQIADQFKPAYTLLFGPDAAALQLPMRFPQFQVQPWGKTSYLQAPALSQMNGEAEEQVAFKKKLWEGLKRMFS